MSAAGTPREDWKQRSGAVFRILWFFGAPLLMVLLLTALSSRVWSAGEKLAAYFMILLAELLREFIRRKLAAKRPDLSDDDGGLALMRPHLVFWLGLFFTLWLFQYLLRY